jgi:hypothetical protein
MSRTHATAAWTLAAALTLGASASAEAVTVDFNADPTSGGQVKSPPQLKGDAIGASTSPGKVDLIGQTFALESAGPAITLEVFLGSNAGYEGNAIIEYDLFKYDTVPTSQFPEGTFLTSGSFNIGNHTSAWAGWFNTGISSSFLNGPADTAYFLVLKDSHAEKPASDGTLAHIDARWIWSSVFTNTTLGIAGFDDLEVDRAGLTISSFRRPPGAPGWGQNLYTGTAYTAGIDATGRLTFTQTTAAEMHYDYGTRLTIKDTQLPVPEPTSVALLGAAAVAMPAIRRMRRA